MQGVGLILLIKHARFNLNLDRSYAILDGDVAQRNLLEVGTQAIRGLVPSHRSIDNEQAVLGQNV